MAGFIQVLEFETDDFDAFNTYLAEMIEEMGDIMRSSQATVLADRDRPGWYFVFVEFDSYEDAMAQSNDPATSSNAEKFAKLVKAPPKFLNLDVLSTMQP